MSDDPALVLDWHRLGPTEVEERIDWLRRSLEPGTDWGYCPELFTCVLKTPEASVMYKLRWFEQGQQRVTDIPAMMKSPGGAIENMFNDEG